MTDCTNSPLTFASATDHCLVCGGKQIEYAYECPCNAESICFVRCKNCGLVFQNPRLTAKAFADCYRALDYFGLHGATSDSAYFDYTRFDWLRERQSRSRIKLIQKASGITAGRLLDIGCASGFFGKVAKANGYQVHGVEPDPILSEFGRSHYGLHIDTCTMEQTALENESYDVVTLWGTDSHFLDPRAGYAKIASALRTGGVLAMNYQDFGHWVRCFFPGLKRGWNSVYNLTDRAMDILLNEVGLELIHRSLEWQWITLGQMLRLVKLPVPHWTWQMPMLFPAVSFRLMLARKLPPA